MPRITLNKYCPLSLETLSFNSAWRHLSKGKSQIDAIIEATQRQLQALCEHLQTEPPLPPRITHAERKKAWSKHIDRTHLIAHYIGFIENVAAYLSDLHWVLQLTERAPTQRVNTEVLHLYDPELATHVAETLQRAVEQSATLKTYAVEVKRQMEDLQRLESVAQRLLNGKEKELHALTKITPFGMNQAV